MRSFIKKMVNYFEEAKMEIVSESSDISEPVVSFVEYVKQHKSKFYFIEKDEDSKTSFSFETGSIPVLLTVRTHFKCKLAQHNIPKKHIQKLLLCYDQENHHNFGNYDDDLEALFDRRNKKLYYFEASTSSKTIRRVSDNISFLNDDERRYLYRELYPILLQIKESRDKKEAEERSLLSEKLNKQAAEEDKRKRQELKEIYCKKD